MGLTTPPGVARISASNTLFTGTVRITGGPNITVGTDASGITLSAAAGGGGLQSAGFSTQGNTAGNTGFASQSFQLVGGNNVTLSGATAAGAATVTIVGPTTVAQSTQTQNLHNLTLSGNTAGVMAQVSSGTLTLAGGNNITLSQAGNAITISGANTVAQTVQTQNLHNVTVSGNTAGVGAAISSGTMTIAGGNNITLSQNGNAVTISGVNTVAQTTQTQNLHNVTLSGNTAGVMAHISSGTMTLAGGNNVTLSQNGNAVTISAAAGGGGNFSAGVSNIGNTAGSTGVSGSRLVLVGSQNVSLSQSTDANGATVSFSAPAAGGGGGVQSAGFSTQGNTSGNTGFATSVMQLVGGNNITLSGATGGGNLTLTISAPNTVSLAAGAGITLSTTTNGVTINAEQKTETMWFPYNEGINVVGGHGAGTLHVAPVIMPHDRLEIDRIGVPVHFSATTNVTGTYTLSLHFGFFTRNVSTLSLAHSTSYTASIPFSGTASAATHMGIRLHTIPWTTTITDDRLFVGVMSRTTTGGTSASISQVVVSQLNSNFAGAFGVASNRSHQWPLGYGYLSASTNAMPASIAFSQLDGTASLAARPPSWFMVSGTA